MTASARRSARQATWSLLPLMFSVLLAACGTSGTRAPVEDRPSAGQHPRITSVTVVERSRPSAASPSIVSSSSSSQAASSSSAADTKRPPGWENAGKPGYHTVKPGETLYRIGLESGQNWKDIMAWNRLSRPEQLEVGQVLRVLPPSEELASASSGVVTRPVGSGSISSSQVRPGRNSQAARSAPVAASATADDAKLNWIWPASGPVIAGFDEVRNKGLDLGGSEGSPILAAADGRVVYVGSGLRGYGNLIILKHNNTYLTAYAHNKSLLVKEDQMVKRGQKIAEMGRSDSDRVKLHFEVRRQGKPVDPLRYLPPR